MAENVPPEEININHLINNQLNSTLDEKIYILPENTNTSGIALFTDDQPASNDFEYCINKKKTETSTQQSKIIKVKKKNSKCELCLQKLDDCKLKLYTGHLNNAHDEDDILFNPKLSLFSGDEPDHAIHTNDMRGLNKITSFSIYCKNGHLCSLDSGLIENGKEIFISGYVKPIWDEDPSVDNGIPAKDLGPIVEWFITGFNCGETANLGISTSSCEYYLMQPSMDYASLMFSIKEKTFLTKIVIECLLDEPDSEYEDLLNKFEITPSPTELPRFSEDLLLYHAQFICDQITSLDQPNVSEDNSLMQAPCIQTLIDLAGVTFKKTGPKKKNYQQRLEEEWKKVYKQRKNSWTKATSTEQVHNLFETFFPDELNKTSNKLSLKRKRCNMCEACLEINCGKCVNCKNMIKFGGPGTSKQACIKRKCPNMEIQEGIEDDGEAEYNESDYIISETESSIEVHRKIMSNLKYKKSSEITWVGHPVKFSKGNFYEAVIIDSEIIKNNDFIFIEPLNPLVPMQVIKVKYMWENRAGIKMLHGTWLWRSRETILGEMTLPRELFMVDECQDVPLTYVQSLANVIERNFSNDLLTEAKLVDLLKENSMLLFCQKRYDPISARFEDLLPDLEAPEGINYFCSTCARDSLEKQRRVPQVFEKLDDDFLSEKHRYQMVKYLGEEFRVGDAVFLKPKTFFFKYSNNQKPLKKSSKNKVIDEEKYPELYRKSNDRLKSSNFDTPEPFDIGYITDIFSRGKSILSASLNLQITVKKLYRPENTCKSYCLRQSCDINMVYWSEDEVNVLFKSVMGKCYLVYSENLDQSIEKWSNMGPNRFYFSEAYNSQSDEFIDPSLHACNVGKCKKKSDIIKTKSIKPEFHFIESPISYPKILKKLRTLDVFSGCGGLSEGLKMSGVSENLWAVESDESAAHAYRLNNPAASVFTTDCNVFLEKILNGETSLNGQRLPRKGEIDLLCGGPPCQGFSGMNRFNSRAYSSFKNSLIVTYLSFCDYYKPRFFIMENVRNFVFFKKSAILKLTLSCLIRMGYQCTFGILQAGCYGVPQTRRRMILIAAGPGEILPNFPKPLNVFSKLTCQLTVEIDDKKYCTLNDSYESAPYRAITVYDAISDLPKIKSGFAVEEARFQNEPLTQFQRKSRKCMDDEYILYDHICKDLGPLVEERMNFIPTKSGSDWRDLPNIEVFLDDTTLTAKLEYKYHDEKSGKSSTGALRGVCRCCEGKPCDPSDRQINTLIPWCLPHTAHRHNQWAGLYGRIDWQGFFSTTITNPEPMSKQGRVLHPEENRVVSVRECARSQGFPDNYRFYGNIQEKHRQIGNAVPPPLAEAIGLEILKSIFMKERKELRI